jgi:hypothetical protein
MGRVDYVSKILSRSFGGKNSSLLRYSGLLPGYWFSTFRRKVLSSSSLLFLNMGKISFFDKSEATTSELQRYFFVYLLQEQNPSRESNRFSAIQKISRIL